MQRILWLLLLIVFTSFIFFSSSLSATESAKMSGYVVKVLNAAFEMVGMSYDGNLEYTIRKLAHSMEFGGQSWLLCKTYSEFSVSKRTSAGYILFFGLLTAVVDEYIQFFTPGRECRVTDVLLDFSGTFCMWLSYRIYQWTK